MGAGEGLASDLLPGRSSGGRGGHRPPDDVEAVIQEVLRKRYLARQRRSVAAVCRDIGRECKVRGLRPPSRSSVLRRIAELDPVTATSAREGADAPRTLRPAGGVAPEIVDLLEQVQIDHTSVDVTYGRPSGIACRSADRMSRRRSTWPADACPVWW